MEEVGGSKRRVESSGESGGKEREEQLNPEKKAFNSVTPSWIPHATVNQPPHERAVDPAVKALAHEQKVRTISDSQRRFAAQFSSSTQGGLERQGDPQVARGSRWASKSARSTAPSNSPDGSCRAEQRHLERNYEHMNSTHRAEESGQESGVGMQKTNQPGSRLQGARGSAEKAEDMDWSRRRSKAEKGDPPERVSTARCQTAGGLVKGPWTREEDQKILDCIAKNMTRWSEIAERVEGRIGKQCRERWFNHLDPTLRKSSWTPEEDEILVQGQARFGNSWTKIAKLLQGRSENAVKNRWNSAARKKGKTTTQRVMPDSFKTTTAVPGSSAADSEYVEVQKVAMTNEERVRRQMQYVMVPSAHHINSRTAPPAPEPSSDFRRNPLLQRFHGGMPHESSNGFPVHQHRLNQQASLEASRPCSVGVPQRHGRPFGQPPPGHETHGQPSTLPSAFLAPQVPLGVASDRQQHLHLQGSSVSAASPEDGFRAGCTSGAAREEASGASDGLIQALLHDSQSLPDSDRIFSTDELSLSNTLLNLSLDEQPTALGGLSGGRKTSDLMGASIGQLDMFDACGGNPALRAMGLGDGEGCGPGCPSRSGGLNGRLTNPGLSQDQFRGKGPMDSSQLLAPAHAQTGVSQAVPYDRSKVAGT